MNANTFLADILSGPMCGKVVGDNSFRRYKTAFRTTMQMYGIADINTTEILYEIGRAGPSAEHLMRQHDSQSIGVDASYQTNSVLAEDFIGYSKKYSNFNATFRDSNLAGIAERLAKGLAASSLFDEVSSETLRGGADLSVNALATYDGPVNSMVSTVFIPRLVTGSLAGDVFTVLANCVAGEGGCIATDIVEVDAATRRPILPFIDEEDLPNALVAALRIIGANMQACGQGPLFALAVVRGIHKVVTLVGHTDEGGIMRDVLRCGHFSIPFGGIHYGLPMYGGLPELSMVDDRHIAGYVDSIAMVSAALVAHCDPGVTVNGEWYPTTYTGEHRVDATARAGVHREGADDMRSRNKAQLLSDLPLFFDLYCKGLGTIFGISGDSSLAVTFASSVSLGLSTNLRHLRLASINPFFWVEPTGLLPPSIVNSDAEDNGSGSLCGKGSSETRGAWEDIEVVDNVDTTVSCHNIGFKNARNCWMILHLNNNPRDGLAHIRFMQLDSSAIVHPGACPDTVEVRDRLDAGLPISSYLWCRGQSPICAPGELINIAGSAGIQARHMYWDEEGRPELTHIPGSDTFSNATVTITVGRPRGIPAAGSNTLSAGVARARTRAAAELVAARRRDRINGQCVRASMPVLHSAPSMRRGAVAKNEDVRESGGGRVLVERAAVGAPEVDSSDSKDDRGGVLKATTLHGVSTGPTPARVGQPATGLRTVPITNVTGDTTDGPVSAALASPAHDETGAQRGASLS